MKNKNLTNDQIRFSNPLKSLNTRGNHHKTTGDEDVWQIHSYVDSFLPDIRLSTLLRNGKDDQVVHQRIPRSRMLIKFRWGNITSQKLATLNNSLHPSDQAKHQTGEFTIILLRSMKDTKSASQMATKRYDQMQQEFWLNISNKPIITLVHILQYANTCGQQQAK